MPGSSYSKHFTNSISLKLHKSWKRAPILRPFFSWGSWGLVKPFAQGLRAGEGPHWELNPGSDNPTVLLPASPPLTFLTPHPSGTLAFSSPLAPPLHHGGTLGLKLDIWSRRRRGFLAVSVHRIQSAFFLLHFLIWAFKTALSGRIEVTLLSSQRKGNGVSESAVTCPVTRGTGVQRLPDAITLPLPQPGISSFLGVRPGSDAPLNEMRRSH